MYFSNRDPKGLSSNYYVYCPHTIVLISIGLVNSRHFYEPHENLWVKWALHKFTEIKLFKVSKWKETGWRDGLFITILYMIFVFCILNSFLPRGVLVGTALGVFFVTNESKCHCSFWKSHFFLFTHSRSSVACQSKNLLRIQKAHCSAVFQNFRTFAQFLEPYFFTHLIKRNDRYIKSRGCWHEACFFHYSFYYSNLVSFQIWSNDLFITLACRDTLRNITILL